MAVTEKCFMLPQCHVTTTKSKNLWKLHHFFFHKVWVFCMNPLQVPTWLQSIIYKVCLTREPRMCSAYERRCYNKLSYCLSPYKKNHPFPSIIQTFHTSLNYSVVIYRLISRTCDIINLCTPGQSYDYTSANKWTLNIVSKWITRIKFKFEKYHNEINVYIFNWVYHN